MTKQIRQDSLLTTHRPATFSEMLISGTDQKLLIRGLESGRLARVLLFSGESGSGKTTAARIVANHLAKSSLDIIEQNCAINNGVAVTRELAQRLHLAPIGGGSKVIILDESHRLTTDSQSALLIAMEDLPSHAVAVFCTTHPHKMLEALRCRAIEYRFTAPSVEDTAQKLCEIAKSEGVDLPLESAKVIAKANGGNVRNSLAALAKLSVYSEITPTIAAEHSRVVSDETLTEFSRNLPRNAAAAIAQLKSILDDSDLTCDEFLERLLEFWTDKTKIFVQADQLSKAASLRDWIKILSGYIQTTMGFSEKNKRQMLDHLVFEINATVTAAPSPSPSPAPKVNVPSPAPAPAPAPAPSPAPKVTVQPNAVDTPTWDDIKAAAIKSRPLYANGLKPVVGQITGSTLRLVNIEPGFFNRVNAYLLQTAKNLGAHHIKEVIK